jgi:RNA polymerase sigma-70 factor (ECF subfamily)
LFVALVKSRVSFARPVRRDQRKVSPALTYHYLPDFRTKLARAGTFLSIGRHGSLSGRAMGITWHEAQCNIVRTVVRWQAVMQITELLQRVHAGDQGAMHALIPLVYGELKKLAAGYLRREGDPRPLETTALVHEAFLRLAQGHHPSYESRSHFYGIASRLMRQVLVDLARARAAQKRSALEGIDVTVIGDFGSQPDEKLLLIDEALNRLASTDPLKTQLIEMRYFGGMTAEECATVLSISVHLVRRELRLAQAWLRRYVEG